MGAEDNGLTLQGLALRLEKLEHENARMRSENAELRHEVAELRGSGPRRGGGRMIGKLTKRVRMAFASSGALSVVVLVVALTAGVAVAAPFTPT